MGIKFSKVPTLVAFSNVAVSCIGNPVQELKDLFGCPLDSQPVAPAAPSKG